MTFYDEEGNAIDALTQEEANAKAAEAREQAIAEANQLREDEVIALQAEKEAAQTSKQELEAQIAEIKGKDYNNGNLRKAIGAKEKEVEELRAKINEVEAGYKAKLADIETKQLAEVKDTFLKSIIGDDPKAKEKVDFYFNKFAPAKNKDEMIDNLRAAVQLAGGGKQASPFSGRVVSSAGGNYEIPTDSSFKGGFDNKEAFLEVAKKAGLSDQEIKLAEAKGII